MQASTAQHQHVMMAKLEFRAAFTTLFPAITERTADKLWAGLRGEVTVEEIQDVVRPLHSLARRIQKARSDGRRWG